MNTTATYTVAELAQLVGATLHGDGSQRVTGVASLDSARPGSVIFAERERDVPRALSSSAAAVVTSLIPGPVTSPAILETTQVRRTFAQICQLLFPGFPMEPVGIHPTAVIDPGAHIGAGVAIGPRVVIHAGVSVGARTVLRAGVVLDEGAVIGEDCYLFPGVVVGRDCRIGHRCVIHPNAVIGGDGFGFTDGFDAALKQPQFGKVVVGDDCEIGACTTIDRGTLDDTVLGDDVKLDNLIMIGHNCQLGNHIRMAAQCGLAGGVIIEDYCVIAGQVGFQNRVRVGRGSLVGGQAGVTRDVAPGSQVWGLPARNHRDVLKELVLLQRLPDIVQRLESAEQLLRQLVPTGTSHDDESGPDLA
ncbi:MAG: UDP-3-O-acylglucosamine N-acyltransferase [bacterium]|nr:UDP-3-O-acylglucosamine N-acyltransferase [bacterium]